MMKTVAVICEYNPFHRGHEYQLMEIRRRFGDCRVVGVMSGAMTERGEPAILDKYSRAEAAVSCGCDLVVELPAPWSMAGAEFFARAGVSLRLGGRRGYAGVRERVRGHRRSPENGGVSVV